MDRVVEDQVESITPLVHLAHFNVDFLVVGELVVGMEVEEVDM